MRIRRALYSFTNLPAGTYTLDSKPWLARLLRRHEHNRDHQWESNGELHVVHRDLHAISGSAGTGGATLTLSGKSGATTTAASTGSYSFTSLAAGTYTVTPSKSGFTFTPPSTTLTISANQTASFTAKAGADSNFYTISGIAGTAGATVTLTGSSGLNHHGERGGERTASPAFQMEPTP